MPSPAIRNILFAQRIQRAAFFPGVAGSYFSTPDSAANSITGDIDMRCELAIRTSATQVFFDKSTGAAQVSFSAYMSGANVPIFFYSNDGTSTAGRVATSSAAIPITLGARFYIRITYAAATGAVDFYTSADGVAWALLGTQQTITAGAIFNGTASLFVGANSEGLFPLRGLAHRIQIYNSIGGTTPAVDFNPNSSNGNLNWASDTSEIWTGNGTVRIDKVV